MKTQNSGICVVTKGGATYYGATLTSIDMYYSNINGLTLLVRKDANKMTLDFPLLIFHD